MSDERKFEIEVLTRLAKIETLLEDFRGVENKCNDAYNLSLNNKQRLDKTEEKADKAYNLSKSNEKRLDKIEDNNKWLFRTTVGAIIVALVGIVLAFVK